MILMNIFIKFVLWHLYIDWHRKMLPRPFSYVIWVNPFSIYFLFGNSWKSIFHQMRLVSFETHLVHAISSVSLIFFVFEYDFWVLFWNTFPVDKACLISCAFFYVNPDLPGITPRHCRVLRLGCTWDVEPLA